jgi:hypothetical protein
LEPAPQRTFGGYRFACASFASSININALFKSRTDRDEPIAAGNELLELIFRVFFHCFLVVAVFVLVFIIQFVIFVVCLKGAERFRPREPQRPGIGVIIRFLKGFDGVRDSFLHHRQIRSAWQAHSPSAPANRKKSPDRHIQTLRAACLPPSCRTR